MKYYERESVVRALFFNNSKLSPDCLTDGIIRTIMHPDHATQRTMFNGLDEDQRLDLMITPSTIELLYSTYVDHLHPAMQQTQNMIWMALAALFENLVGAAVVGIVAAEASSWHAASSSSPSSHVWQD